MMICDGRLINACFAYFTLALVYNYLWFHDAIIADAREVNNLRTLTFMIISPIHPITNIPQNHQTNGFFYNQGFKKMRDLNRAINKKTWQKSRQ